MLAVVLLVHFLTCRVPCDATRVRLAGVDESGSLLSTFAASLPVAKDSRLSHGGVSSEVSDLKFNSRSETSKRANSSDEECDFCPNNQKDSTECKDMFTAWMTGLSIYNAAVPGVPVDLLFCCPCMTKRLFSRGPDLSAIGQADVQAMLEAGSKNFDSFLNASSSQSTAETAAHIVGRLRKARALAVYKEDCQERHTFSTKMNQMGRAQAQAALTPSTKSQRCSALESLHPEFAVYWMHEVLRDICPLLVPYHVKIQLSSNPHRAHGIPIGQKQVAAIQKVLSKKGVAEELKQLGEAAAGERLRELLLQADPLTVTDGNVTQDFHFLSADGTVNLRSVKSHSWNEPFWQDDAMSMDWREEDLADLQEEHKRRFAGKYRRKIYDIPLLRRQLAMVNGLSKLTADRLPGGLLHLLDPLGALQIRSEEALSGLELVGFQMPGQAEESLPKTALGSAVFGTTAGFASASAYATALGYVGAEIGTVAFPIVGTVAGTVAGAIIGGIVGLTVGALRSAAANANKGTLILQGWHVEAAPSTIKSLLEGKDAGEVMGIHLKQSCNMATEPSGHKTPLSTTFTSAWRPTFSGSTTFASEDWGSLPVLAGLSQEVNILETKDVKRPPGTTDWLKDGIGRIATDGHHQASLLNVLSKPADSELEFDNEHMMTSPSLEDEIEEEKASRVFLGHMPEKCWSSTPFKKLWDTLLGTQGGGLVCKPLAKLLKVGVYGASALLFDPFSAPAKWIKRVRPPHLWSSSSFRQHGMTVERITALLQQAVEPSKQPKVLSTFTVQLGREHPIYAFAIKVSDASQKLHKGPRVGAASGGDTLPFFELIEGRHQFYLRVVGGWLAPCRLLQRGKLQTKVIGITETFLKIEECSFLKKAVQAQINASTLAGNITP